MTYELVFKKPSELQKYAKNSRTHTDEQIRQVMASIQEFGFTNPILIHGKTILAGHCRLEAAKRLGFTEVPTIALDSLTKEQARAYVIADNKLALNAGWDDSILKEEIEALMSADYAVELLGFTDEELADLGIGVEEPQESDKDPDEVPEVPQNIHGVKRGDVWELGNHRLVCGDSTSKEDVDRLMQGEKADMVFTDPPYGVNYDGGIQFKNGTAVKGARKKLANDDSQDIYTKSVPMMARYSRGPIYTWYAASEGRSLYDSIQSHGEYHAMIVWVKNGGYGALNACYKQKHEPCVFWKPKGETLRWAGPTTENTIWDLNKDGKNEFHPTQKPVALAERAIGNHEAKTVLDLFGGSGSTLIACEKTGRHCRMMELDEHYCSVIIERWQQFTNQKAVKIGGTE